MPIRISTSLPRKTPQLLAYCRGVDTAMTDNPNFKEISPEFRAALGSLKGSIGEVQTAYDAAKRHDPVMIAYRDSVLKALIALMVDIARHIELVAKGDVNILKSTGFKLVQPQFKTVQYALVAALMTLGRGRLSGTMVAKGKSLPGAWRYEFWLTEKDPTIEENWTFYCDSPHCSRVEITGRTPGQNVSVRMRGVWAAGPGPWSPTVTLMSL